MDTPMYGYMTMAALWVASCYDSPDPEILYSRLDPPDGQDAQLVYSSNWEQGDFSFSPTCYYVFRDGSVCEVTCSYAEERPVVDVWLEVDANLSLFDD